MNTKHKKILLRLSACTGRALRYPVTVRYLIRVELSATGRIVRSEPSCTGIIDEQQLAREKKLRGYGTLGAWRVYGGPPRSNPWVPYFPFLENPNFPIPCQFSLLQYYTQFAKIIVSNAHAVRIHFLVLFENINNNNNKLIGEKN